MGYTTQLFYIRYHDGVLTLYNSENEILRDHQLPVPAGNDYEFIFDIPDDGPEEGLRFKRAGDPPPDEPVTWGVPVIPPGIHQEPAEDKELSIKVNNGVDLDEEVSASFTLNLFDTRTNSSLSACIQKEEGSIGIDPTIVEKPPEPPKSY